MIGVPDSVFDSYTSGSSMPPIALQNWIAGFDTQWDADNLDHLHIHDELDVVGLAREIIQVTKGAVLSAGVKGLLGYNAVKAVLGGTALYELLGKPSLAAINVEFSPEEEITARVVAGVAIILTSVTFWTALGMAGVFKIGRKVGAENQLEVSTESLEISVNQD
jgi:hypothetical protein